MARHSLHRFCVVLGLALFAGYLGFLGSLAHGAQLSDFGLVWAAAKCLLHGENPYALIGPGRPIAFAFRLNYPLTAPLGLLPFGLLSRHLADALFLALGAGALAYALTRQTIANPQLCVFLSYGFLATTDNVQWGLLMAAAGLIPALGFLLACKPTIGLAWLVAYPSRRALARAGLLGVVSIVLFPWWPAEWVTVLQSQPHILAPVTLVSAGGPLLLLGLLKWRRPEARLLVALACIPHTITLYETIALFLVVETWTEGILLAALSVVLFHLQSTPAAFQTWIEVGARWQALLMYLPCLLLVLRRANVWTSETDGLRRLLVWCETRYSATRTGIVTPQTLTT